MPETKSSSPNSFSSKFLLAAATSLVGGVLWLSSCAPPTTNNAANNTTDNAAGNRSTPNATPAPTAALKVPGTTFTLYVPNAQAMLSRQIVKDASTPAGATYEQKSKRVLELLFKKLEFLPKETRLLEAPKKEKNGDVRLNLSKQFLKLDKLPETPVALTLDAISKTLGAFDIKNGKIDRAAKVRFLAEGKVIRTLSQFSLDEPWQASTEDEAAPDKPGGGV